MKNSLYLLLISLFTLFSCSDKKGVRTENDISKSTEKTAVSTPKTAKETETKYAELFNVELVGLTQDPENAKRYFVDFSAACMCNSPSILMKGGKAYLFGYCKDKLPPNSEEPFYEYDIVQSIETEKGISIALKNEKTETLELLFEKSDTKFVYKLTVSGEFPTDYIGGRLCPFFTTNSGKFEIEDCGGFDG